MKKRKTFQKKLENFVKDESGSVSKDKVLKIGLGTIAALGALSAFAPDAGSQATHTSYCTHQNNFPGPPSGIPTAGGDYCGMAHNNTEFHTNHNSY